MSLRRRVALAVALSAALSPLAASAADGTEWTFDERYDFELQDEHAKAVEERAENAAEERAEDAEEERAEAAEASAPGQR